MNALPYIQQQIKMRFPYEWKRTSVNHYVQQTDDKFELVEKYL